MNLDHRYILVFLRQNIFLDHQTPHAIHLGIKIGQLLEGYCQKRNTLSGIPSVLVYEVDNEAELKREHERLASLGIEGHFWADPDVPPGRDDYGDTGFITEAITKTQRNKLPRFKVWKYQNNRSLVKTSHAPVAQTGASSEAQEHPVSNGEVGTATCPGAPVSEGLQCP